MAKLPPLPAPLFDTAAIVGIGLIGSSIARAVAKVGAVRRLVICDHDADALARAEALDLGQAYVALPPRPPPGPTSSSSARRLALTRSSHRRSRRR